MPRANRKTTTAKAKKPKAGKADAPTTANLADRLSDIAGQLDVVAIAIFGINEISDGDPAMAPLMTMVQEISKRVRAVSDDVHPSPAVAS